MVVGVGTLSSGSSDRRRIRYRHTPVSAVSLSRPIGRRWSLSGRPRRPRQTTKSRRTRVVPIGTARLLAVLKWLQLDVVGDRKSDDVLIFSDEVGEPLRNFKKAWSVAVLKAHGVKPRWQKGSYKDLDAQSRQHFRKINLHWHDLRHEYASRLVERSVPLAQVRDLLGHASITTTERYDNQRLEALQAAAERLESGKEFDRRSETPDKVSRIFQDRAEKRTAGLGDDTPPPVRSH